MGLTKFYWRIKEMRNDLARRTHAIIASHDGHLYEVRDSEIGRLVVKAQAIKELDIVTEGFRFDLPLVPVAIYQQIYSFFTFFCSQADVEVMLQLFYDKEEKKYLLECPIQTVSKVRIDAKLNEQFLGRNSLRYIQVAQFHSHNSMSAYFSKTDDEDEKSFMIYGVFGQLDKNSPQAVFRVKANDSYIRISGKQLFEDTSFRLISFPCEWVKNITII